MRRNWDLIREILTSLEEADDINTLLMAKDFPDWPAEQVCYHLWLLIQSGLIVGRCNHEIPRKGFQCYGVCMTWAGQEFLAAIKNDTAWKRIKTLLKDKSIDLSYEAIKTVALSILQ